ncbi:DUF6301 family protein [Nocardia sp. NPDC052566]|uniref:DUF6301 family protein n=1 Tax=Nocardia sp. NPDC052566 TaxID=3364330 RepID=UPI0037C836DA
MEFDWRWTVDDLPGFAHRVGWQVGSLDVLSPPLTTDFQVNRTDAQVFAASKAVYDRPREVKSIWFDVSDVVLDNPAVKPVLWGCSSSWLSGCSSWLGKNRSNGGHGTPTVPCAGICRHLPSS